MVSLINLFVSILKSPTSLPARSDMALMDIAAGHFGHMEFITSSEMVFPFARDVAALAQKTVKAAGEGSAPGSARSESPMMSGPSVILGSEVDLGNEVSSQDPLYIPKTYLMTSADDIFLTSWIC
jgi:hypothetical protein